MLSQRLVRTIQDHAEPLTRAALDEISRNPRTAAYHGLGGDELRRRIHDVYSNLGRWVADMKDDELEQVYAALGQRRRGEGIPLPQVVYALILTKRQLRDYMLRQGGDSALELHQEEELHLLVENFFDKAVYFTVQGYSQSI